MSPGVLDQSLDNILGLLATSGVVRAFLKFLAPNDNSKNQPYLAKGDLSVLSMLPMGTISESREGKTPAFRASFPLYWITPDGSAEPAPGSKLIVYPKYPEVRLSGFLQGTRHAPNALMASRLPGRILILGVTGDRRVLGVALHPDSPAAIELTKRADGFEQQGVLFSIPLAGTTNSRDRLLSLLGEVHRAGWTDSVRLTSEGLVPCIGTNCGGCTLEALMGIASNSTPGPDFEDWEIKGHLTRGFDRSPTGQVTLMTPAPTGGLYKEDAVGFVQRFGYPDRSNAGRRNFSSPHRVGQRNAKTGLTASLIGFDLDEGTIAGFDGRLTLTDDDGFQAAAWDFPSLMEKWIGKHSKAAFVPYLSKPVPHQQYAFGHTILLGEGTDFFLFLRELAAGHVAYDPGIWVENGRLGKARSQFRVAARYVPNLYRVVDQASVR